MRRFIPSLGSALLLLIAPIPGAAQAGDDDSPPTIEEHTSEMEKLDGFMPIYWDDADGKLWLEIGRWNEQILHYTSLPAGFGQNDLGLNRGDLGGSRVVVFRRVGPKIFMEEPNLTYRALTDDPLEEKSVRDGFPSSIHQGWTVAAQTGDRVLVDATDFFMKDWHDIIGSLRRSNQGTYRLDASRSAPYRERTRVFPQNTEVEVTLTFTSDQPGGLVRSVAADGGAVTIRQHHSFVQLPELGSYTPRAYDPRSGYGGVSWYDFATPIEEPLVKRYIRRHRLEKADPSAEVSDPVEPIVYYLDPGTPEPVRTALLTGGDWWAEAFEAAGFSNAFRMEMLPDTADPMDARYNVVQWVHRSTRGWSYGASIADPRTGEILKGHVTLGSLRVRQDYLIGEGLTSPYATGTESPDDVMAMSLHRIRQLSAHEIGHTIGLSHNYIASAERDAGNMSVMDYPHPRSTLEPDGTISLESPYDEGIGEWDKVAIDWGYRQFPGGGDDREALDAILMDAAARGVTFMTDQDARSANSAHPQNHLWDNGEDVAAELERMMDVRRVALDRFGESAIETGEPMAQMEEVLVPLYLHHRYQAEATTKIVGGLYYTYALRGDGQEPLRRVPAAEQNRALEALLRTLDPEELKMPQAVLETLPPRPPGMGGGDELFRKWTSPAFDAVSPAAAAADATLSFLLNSSRAARLVEQSALDASMPSLADVLERLTSEIMQYSGGDAYAREINRVVQQSYVNELMSLAASAPMPQVRAEATFELDRLQDMLEDRESGERTQQAMDFVLANDIERFLERPFEAGSSPNPPAMPAGSPIGMAAPLWLEPFAGGVWEMPTWGFSEHR
ncbi:zinc-dependent metalloprotease [Gaopeijia maritima]|uniref:Zinc-dependent metalloprotease n=1 Tax=Gaopeijia maritima TaxID=3119007 RepID=A0ABU9E4S7_9BACT